MRNNSVLQEEFASYLLNFYDFSDFHIFLILFFRVIDFLPKDMLQ